MQEKDRCAATHGGTVKSKAAQHAPIKTNKDERDSPV
jgi:hypothetical protein